jgi:hypothetical protein
MPALPATAADFLLRIALAGRAAGRAGWRRRRRRRAAPAPGAGQRRGDDLRAARQDLLRGQRRRQGAHHHHLRPPRLHPPRQRGIQGTDASRVAPGPASCPRVRRSRVSVLTLAAAQGRFTAGQDDEMLVKVELKKIPRSDARAVSQLQESISFKGKVCPLPTAKPDDSRAAF